MDGMGGQEWLSSKGGSLLLSKGGVEAFKFYPFHSFSSSVGVVFEHYVMA